LKKKDDDNIKKQKTLIATVRNHLQTFASLPTPPPFSLPTTFIAKNLLTLLRMLGLSEVATPVFSDDQMLRKER
jgi:hypothetical protein